MSETSRKAGQISGFYIPNLAKVYRTCRKKTDIIIGAGMPNDLPLGHMPGQFVQVSVLGYGEAPISVCSSPTRSHTRFELCVRPVGNFTRALYEQDAGNWIGIRGPFGRGFPVARAKGRDILVVAGGIGIAPLRSLINYIMDKRRDYGRLMIVYGAKTPDLILFTDDIRQWEDEPGTEVFLTVDEPDDAWKGRTGVVTIPVREIEIDPDRTVAMVVGPPVMYRFVAMELLKKKMNPDNIFFSLERHFKCGMGKCGHCQLNDLYVCQDGPTFRYSDLLGRTEAIEAWAPEKDQDR